MHQREAVQREDTRPQWLGGGQCAGRPTNSAQSGSEASRKAQRPGNPQKHLHAMSNMGNRRCSAARERAGGGQEGSQGVRAPTSVLTKGRLGCCWCSLSLMPQG